MLLWLDNQHAISLTSLTCRQLENGIADGNFNSESTAVKSESQSFQL